MTTADDFFLSILSLTNNGFLFNFVSNLVALTIFFMFLPGIGGGLSGLFLRAPIILALALSVTLNNNQIHSKITDLNLILFHVSVKAFAVALIPVILIGAIRTAGYFVGVSSGLNFAGIVDPTLGQHQTEISKLLGDLTLFLFLVTGGHLILFKVLFSYDLLFHSTSFEETAFFLLDLFAKTFSFGFLFSLPMLGGIFLTNLGLGLISKAVPTFNVFVMGYPLTLFLGVSFILFFIRNMQAYTSILLDLVS
ncbi:MAG: flagellar biosynthetic protein FliR [Deltaproteobacteria bacterium]|nr:flagellar biosynthetic protein FliR [Deltaproteobacteria bacterium]MCX7953423.1 flagellar biosynthetic protein FliR [Deltaproteobacteria bacterium]